MYLQNAFEICKIPDRAQAMIIDAYNEPHRKYHNIDHIKDVVRHYDGRDADCGDTMSMIKAALFHDVVYRATPEPPGMNEARSILVYSHLLEEIDDLVVMAINATAYHTVDQKPLPAAVKEFLDFDLSGFALTPNDFRQLNARVEEELLLIYGNENKTKVMEGRIAFLEKLQARKSVFYVWTDWEEQAQENIANEIEYVTYRLANGL